MNAHFSRRRFLGTSAAAGAAFGLDQLRLPRVSAADAHLHPRAVRLRPEIEPLVRLIENTPRERLLEEVASRIRQGTTYPEVLAALLLAGVRNIQPRPVGFKFHAVLVVNSAHLASISSPDEDRWLPIFWALDYFKDSQGADQRAGDWTMSDVDEAALPPPHRAREAFIEAMDNWDESVADVAVAALARTASPEEIFEIFSRYGARDFRDIGHKAIYVANSWRTLQSIGWQHAEPVLRSLAYALLERGDQNPAKADLAADRPWRRNLPLSRTINDGWRNGKYDDGGAVELLTTVRDASDEAAAAKVVALLNRGIAAQSVWDGLFAGAAELPMRRPDILSLHAVTTINALHFAYQTSREDDNRKMMMLQAAAFLPLFRGNLDKGPRIDAFEPSAADAGGVTDIFAEVTRDRMSAARNTLAYLQSGKDAKALIDTARRLIFVKGQNAHDYKFSSAVLEDFSHVSPAWRERFLAASVFLLRGSGAKDNTLIGRARAALTAS